MEILTLTLNFILISGSLLLIGYPLWKKASEPETMAAIDPVEQRLRDYHARYEAALSNIKQLMFDHETGKISAEDYQALLAQTKQEAADIRQKIDYYADGVSTATEFALDAKAEMLITQMKQQDEPFDATLLAQVDLEIEQLKQQAHPASPTNGAASMRLCPSCHQPYQAGDMFCTVCGASLKPSAPESANKLPAV